MKLIIYSSAHLTVLRDTSGGPTEALILARILGLSSLAIIASLSNIGSFHHADLSKFVDVEVVGVLARSCAEDWCVVEL